MPQKWEYKTVLRTQDGITPQFEIDGVAAPRPKAWIDLLAALGEDGWELVSHSSYILPAPVQYMSEAEHAMFPTMDGGSVSALARPTVVEWLFFKRPSGSETATASQASATDQLASGGYQ